MEERIEKAQGGRYTLSALKNAWPATENCKPWSRAYCLSKRKSLVVGLKAMSNKLRINKYRVAVKAGTCIK